MTTTTIDCTPSPAATKRMLQMIIEGSTSASDVDWATAEMARCFPAFAIARDTVHNYLILGDLDRLSVYCTVTAAAHGAGTCDILQFQPGQSLQGAIEFASAGDVFKVMHFDNNAQLMPGAGQ